MDKEQALQSVNEIKELMEKSSKFTSLSGLTAIMAGGYSLVGAYAASCILESGSSQGIMVMIAVGVLLASALTACMFSFFKSKKMGQRFFSKLTYRIGWNFSLPLFTGGLVCISLLLHADYGMISSVMLLFYGLALVNVSKYTYSDIAWLGYAFISLGIVDCFFEGHALLYWTIGFGGLHILYGVLFYFHYEKK